MKPVLLILSALLVFSPPLPAYADGDPDYRFKDSYGNVIENPVFETAYSDKSPGPWKGKEAMHTPRIKAIIRKDGLEMTRVLTVSVDHPDDDSDGRIEALYLLDKDGLVVGHESFKKDHVIEAEMWLTSVINYVQIYVKCTKHGVWRKEVRF